MSVLSMCEGHADGADPHLAKDGQAAVNMLLLCSQSLGAKALLNLETFVLLQKHHPHTGI